MPEGLSEVDLVSVVVAGRFTCLFWSPPERTLGFVCTALEKNLAQHFLLSSLLDQHNLLSRREH